MQIVLFLRVENLLSSVVWFRRIFWPTSISFSLRSAKLRNYCLKISNVFSIRFSINFVDFLNIVSVNGELNRRPHTQKFCWSIWGGFCGLHIGGFYNSSLSKNKKLLLIFQRSLIRPQKTSNFYIHFSQTAQNYYNIYVVQFRMNIISILSQFGQTY